MGQYSSYYKYQRYEKRGSQDWIPCYPNTYSISGDSSIPMPLSAKSECDPNCGCQTAIYRWVNLDPSVDYYCDECPLVPPTPATSGDYFIFLAQENGTFKFSKHGEGDDIQYSLDSGATWVSLASNTDSPTVVAGNEIWWKSTITPSNLAVPNGGIGTFSSSGKFQAKGNSMSLLFGDNFSGQTSLTSKICALESLFINCSGLTNIDWLILPATTLAPYCYYGMFENCTSLTTLPSGLLPATTLANGCYNAMFHSCTSLASIPSNFLLATTLALACYRSMFRECTSLTTLPSGLLPATTLASECYYIMFKGCTSLTTVPTDLLPSTTLGHQCYAEMFNGCTSLTNVPNLPATTLTDYCYRWMFKDCTSLTTVPTDLLPSTTLANFCYQGMFHSCTQLTTAPILSASTLLEQSYREMFYNCKKLNYIKCLATDISAAYCTTLWTAYVASSGTFVKNSSMNDWTSGISGIPDNWTIQNA